jgi:hypothetical protein
MSEYTTNALNAAKLHNSDTQLLNRRAASRYTTLEMSEYTITELHDAKRHNSDKQPLNNKCGNGVRKRLRRSHGVTLCMCQCYGRPRDRVQDDLESFAADGDEVLNKNMSSGGPLHNAVHNSGPLHMLMKAAATQCCPKLWPAT